jgi:hypothetical protein
MDAAYKRLLSKFGTFDTVLKNPFYLLGLSLSASQSEIRRRREDLDVANAMGQKEWNDSFPYLLKGTPLPSYGEICEAFSSLEDIEKRIVASYYWFWGPDNDECGGFHKAFDCFLSGNVKEADMLWSTVCSHHRNMGKVQLQNGFHIHVGHHDKFDNAKSEMRNVARHNLAVLHRYEVMLDEVRALRQGIELTQEEADQLNGKWAALIKEEFSAHAFVVGDYNQKLPQIYWQPFLKFISKRYGSRITQEFLVSINEILYELPFLWQLLFAEEYVRRGEWSDAYLHMSLIKEVFPKYSVSENVLMVIFDKMKRRHNVLIQSCEGQVYSHPEEGLRIVNALIDSTRADLDVVCTLLGYGDGETTTGNEMSQESINSCGFEMFLESLGADRKKEQQMMFQRIREIAFDPVVNACLEYMIKYVEVTEDWSAVARWCDFLYKLAVSERLKNVITALRQKAVRAPVGPQGVDK